MRGSRVAVLRVERPLACVKGFHIERQLLIAAVVACNFCRPCLAHLRRIVCDGDRRILVPERGNGDIEGDFHVVFLVGVRRGALCLARRRRLDLRRICAFRVQCGQRERLGRGRGIVTVVCRASALHAACLGHGGYLCHLPCAEGMRMFRNDLRLVHGDGNGNILCPFRRKGEDVAARLLDREGRARREREIVRRLAVQRIGDVDLRILRCRPGECELIARRDLRLVRFRRDDGRGALLFLLRWLTGGKGKCHTARRRQDPRRYKFFVHPAYLPLSCSHVTVRRYPHHLRQLSSSR